MDFTESVVKAIENIFKLSGDKVSSLTAMLSNIETNRLYDKFSTAHLEKEYTAEDLVSKVNLLDALLEILLENPDMENILPKTRKELITDVSRAAAELYEQALLQVEDNAVWENMPYLVMYSMLSYMADQQTMSDLFIKQYATKLSSTIDLYYASSGMQQLEYDTYYLIVSLLSNIRNQEGLLQVNRSIERANQNLEKIQEEEIKCHACQNKLHNPTS